MCISPIYVPNPYYCPYDSKRRDDFEKLHQDWFLHDTQSAMIAVPCGVCAECLQLRQLEFVQRAVELSKFSYVLFGTLTYDDDSLPMIKANEFTLKVADIRDFQKFVKRLRKFKILPEFRYLAVTEYGTKKHRPHFHFLFFIPFEYKYDIPFEQRGFEYAKKVLEFIPKTFGWSRSYGDSFNPLYKPLSQYIRTINNYTYDCHFVTGNDKEDVAFYVSKYVLKFSEYVDRLQSALRLNLNEEDYWNVWSKVRPRILTSNGVGYLRDLATQWPKTDLDYRIDLDITAMIERSIRANEEVPQYYLKSEKYPLCHYFIERCMSLEQRIAFHNLNYNSPFEDESKQIFPFEEELTDLTRLDKVGQKIDKFLNVKIQLNKNNY